MDYKAMIDGLIAKEYGEAMGPIEVTDEVIKKQHERDEEVKKCNHLFVVTRSDEHYTTIDGKDHYSAPTIECVHCGVSNRLVNYHNRLWNEDPSRIHSGYPFEGALFLENFIDYFKDGKIRDGHFENIKAPFLSNEVLDINNAKYWYDAARSLKPNATDEEIFETMKYLLKIFRENVSKVQLTYSR